MCALARRYFISNSDPLFCLFLLIWILNQSFHIFFFILSVTVFVPQYLKTAQAVLVSYCSIFSHHYHSLLLLSMKVITLTGFHCSSNSFHFIIIRIGFEKIIHWAWGVNKRLLKSKKNSLKIFNPFSLSLLLSLKWLFISLKC